MNGEALGRFFSGGCAFLSSNKEYVNELNVFPVPDGDTGTNMGLTITSAVKGIGDNKTASKVATGIANGALMGARGNSGVILSQILRGFSQGIGDNEVVTPKIMALSIQKGVDLAYRTVMKPVEGTILTVAKEMGIRANEIVTDEMNMVEFLSEVIKAGHVALENTPNQLPALKAAGVVDAGGQGLLFIFEGGLRALLGESLEMSEEELNALTRPTFKIEADENKEKLTYGYCTEFFIHAEKYDEEKIKNFLGKRGDSIVVVGGENLVKVHVHTDNPGVILDYVLRIGSLHDIKIDNMNDQHRESDLEPEATPKTVEYTQNCAIVAVSAGSGLDELFLDLGVSVIVSGGQSMNPSAEDIIKAINEAPAGEVVVLPNNSNIIMAAEQSATLAEKKVVVLPTKYIPQGLSSMLGFDPDASAEENAEAMAENYAEVKSGQITYAVRDSSANGLDIKKDDILGLAGKEIVAVSTDMKEVIFNTIEKMVTANDSIITLIYGEEVEAEAAEELATEIAEKYSNFDVEIQMGGQSVYYYLIGVE